MRRWNHMSERRGVDVDTSDGRDEHDSKADER